MEQKPLKQTYWAIYNRKRASYLKKYKQENADHIRNGHRKWCSENREKRRASAKRYYQAHPERLKARHKTWMDKNIDYVKAKRREDWANNKDVRKAFHKEYHRVRYQNDPKYRARLILQIKLWTEANREKVKAMHRLAASKRRAIIRGSTVNPDGLKKFMNRISKERCVACYYCGQLVSGSARHVDHVVPLSRGGVHAVGNFCISCRSCNSSKNAHLLSEWKRDGQIMLSL